MIVVNVSGLGLNTNTNTYTENVFQTEKRNRNTPKGVYIRLKYCYTLILATQTTQSPKTSLLKCIPITQYIAKS